LEPSGACGDDLGGVCPPDEGFRVFVVLDDEPVDGRLQVGDGAEDAMLEAPAGELGEESLDGIQP